MELTSEYSSWFLILCVALAGLYTFWLYGKNKQNQELPIWVVRVLAALRFTTVFVLAVLLLNPIIQKWITQSEPPLILIAQDNSASILNNADSSFYLNEYKGQLAQLESRISENYKVVALNFGDAIITQDSGLNFTDKRTSYAQLFDEIDARYAGENIGALIFASDGLYNTGANPEYYNFKQPYPIYTLGLGDTTQKSDMAIAEIRTNDLVYLGNDFPVEVTVSADLLSGKEAILSVYSNGKLLEKRALKITDNAMVFTEKFGFTASDEGTQRFVFSVTKFDNELNTKNNQRQVLVDVLDNRDKILIIANAPHPDIAALREVLEEKESYEVTVELAENAKPDFSSYNLVIAHGFGQQKYTQLWNTLYQAKVPTWLMLYAKTSAARINAINPGFTLEGEGQKTNRILPSFNNQFNDFQISEETRNYLGKTPPLTSPFAEVTGTNDNQTLLYQKIGSVQTDFPLAYFNNRNDTKTAWLFGEGVWRWKYFDYQENKTTHHFSEWVWKTVQYLAVKEDKSRFRIKVNKRFNENVNVKLQAEFYDKSYEKTDDFEVGLELTNENGNKFSYTFNPIGLGYSLDVGKLKPGLYNYVAKVSDGSKLFKRSGSFIVIPVDVEYAKISADFTVLKKLSSKTNGKFYIPSEMNNLAKVFEDKTKFPSISYTSEKKEEVVHFKWIFALVISLLTVEWLLRKLKGRY